MCEENRPKQVGDACVEPADCLPEVATFNADHTVNGVYLRCDVEAGQCVTRPAPAPPADWLAPCGLTVDDFAAPGTFGDSFRASDACSSGFCLFYDTDDQTCVPQGCTATCSTDGDCPNGSWCAGGVCRIREASWSYLGLACPPD